MSSDASAPAEPLSELNMRQKCETISGNLSRVGTFLKKTGCALVQRAHLQLEKSKEVGITSGLVVEEVMCYPEVVELLVAATDFLTFAGNELKQVKHVHGSGMEGSAPDASIHDNVDSETCETKFNDKPKHALLNNEKKRSESGERAHVQLQELVDVIEDFGKILDSKGIDSSKVNDAMNSTLDLEQIFVNADPNSSCWTKLRNILCKLLEDAPVWLLSLYRIVFTQSVEEVAPSGPGTCRTRRELVLGGYGVPKRPYMLHVYFLTMVLVVANWFFVMFFDTAFYRKSTTCNDLNTRRDAYLCFDVSKSILAGPTNCTDPAIKDDLDIYVLCYLQYFNFPTALSLAFGLAQVIILLIHISFTLTLWCVKNFTPYAALVIHLIILISYIIFWVVYLPILYTNVNEVEYRGNLFYGHRILRYFMGFLGLLTLFFLTIFSPYEWLIDKNSSKTPQSTYSLHPARKNL